MRRLDPFGRGASTAWSPSQEFGIARLLCVPEVEGVSHGTRERVTTWRMVSPGGGVDGYERERV